MKNLVLISTYLIGLQFIQEISGINECGRHGSSNSLALSTICTDGINDGPKSQSLFYHSSTICQVCHDKANEMSDEKFAHAFCNGPYGYFSPCKHETVTTTVNYKQCLG